MTPGILFPRIVCPMVVLGLASPGGGAPDFGRDVLPILERRCKGCHGPEKASGGLRLDTRDEALKGGKKGEDIVPGKSSESRLIQLVRAESKPHMPPKGEPLTKDEIEAIARWIDAGALPPSSDRAASSPAPAGRAFERPPWEEQPILALAASPDGSLIASAQGQAVVIREAAGGQAREVLRSGRGFFTSLAFHPGGRLLAAGEHGEVRLYSVVSPGVPPRAPEDGDSVAVESVRVLGPHASRVLSLAFGAKGDLLLAGGGVASRSGELKVWETATGSLLHTIAEHADTILALAVSPEGGLLATGSADRLIHLHELPGGRRIRRFIGHSHHVTALTFDPDGKHILSAGADQELRLWDIEKPLPVRSFAGHGAEVYAAAFDPDGKWIISASADRTIRMWNPWDGRQVRSFGGEAADQLYTIVLLDGGKLVASGGRDRILRIHETGTGALKLAVSPGPPAPGK